MRLPILNLLIFTNFLGGVTSSSNTWSGWGGSIQNDRWVTGNNDVTSSKINTLKLHCKIPSPRGQSAAPAISGDYAYYPVWNGSLVALNYKTCQIKWSINITQIIVNFKPIASIQQLVQKPTSRTSPQIDKLQNVLYFGTLSHALLVAVDLNTGGLLGRVQVNPHVLAQITSSPTFYSGLVFVGAASQEEPAEFIASLRGIPYDCCTFIGNAAAFRFTRIGATGVFSTIWNTTTIPTNIPRNGSNHWAGAGIWGGQPAIDASRGQVFFATGNVMSIPDSYIPCSQSDDPRCLPEYIWQEAVFSLDIFTGRPRWVRRLNKLDAWHLSCGTPLSGIPYDPVACPQNPGNDVDFGMGPSFVKGNSQTPRKRDIVTIGQKSGIVYGLRADNGQIQWSTMTCPGDEVSGMSWGVAADDKRTYYTGINYYQRPWTLKPGNSTQITNSLFGAVTHLDGSIIWQTPAPLANLSLVPPTVVNDLVLTGATGNIQFNNQDYGTGTFIVLKKRTGQIIFQYPLDQVFHGGIAVQGQYIMLGTGYGAFRTDLHGSFYVFKVGR